MKGRTGAVLTLLVIGAVAVGFFMISDTVFNLGFGIIADKKVSASVAILTQARSVLSLNTLEVVRKVVFPYDFVPAEMEWNAFLKEKENRPLSLQEAGYLETFELCSEIGIDLRKKRREFVVLTTIIKAGFDLSSPVFSSPEQAGAALAERYVRIDHTGGVTMQLPPAVITEIILDDADTATYRYPDLEIGPEGWKKLTSFVTDRLVEEAVSDEVLDMARENGKQFLSRIFLDTGYSNVSFSE
jgi:hypothetical protein